MIDDINGLFFVGDSTISYEIGIDTVAQSVYYYVTLEPLHY